MVDHVVFDAYGNKLVADTGNGGVSLYGYTQESVFNVASVFGFQGMLQDPAAEIGGTASFLYYDNERWVNTFTGQFESTDPSGYAAGDNNLYRFDGNDPVNNTDPTGLMFSTGVSTDPLQAALNPNAPIWTGTGDSPGPVLNVGYTAAGPDFSLDPSTLPGEASSNSSALPQVADFTGEPSDGASLTNQIENSNYAMLAGIEDSPTTYVDPAILSGMANQAAATQQLADLQSDANSTQGFWSTVGSDISGAASWVEGVGVQAFGGAVENLPNEKVPPPTNYAELAARITGRIIGSGAQILGGLAITGSAIGEDGLATVFGSPVAGAAFAPAAAAQASFGIAVTGHGISDLVNDIFNPIHLSTNQGGKAASSVPKKTQFGWTGSGSWNDAVATVSKGGTLENIQGKIPTQQEALDMIQAAGADLNEIRIEGAHEPPNPHQYLHINYYTASGVKGTIRIAQ